jgi:hypothetical protein
VTGRNLTRASWALIGLAVALVAAGPLLLPRDALRDLLVRLEPWSLSLHVGVFFIALCAAAVRGIIDPDGDGIDGDSIRQLQLTYTVTVNTVNPAEAVNAVKGANRARANVLLVSCLCAAIGVAAALFLAPRTHRLYFDEDIYVQVGHSIAHDAQAGMVEIAVPDKADPRGWRGLEYSLNKEPSGYPFLIAVASRLGFTGDGAGRAASLACFALGIVALGMFGFGISRAESSAAAGAISRNAVWLAPFAFALWPENLRWAVTSAADIAAAGLAIFALALAEAAGRDRSMPDRARETEGASEFPNRPLAVAAALAAAFAAQARPEGFLLFVPWVILMRPWGLLRDPLPLAALAAPLVVPFWHFASVMGEDWGASGPRFSAAYVAANFAENFPYWFRADMPGNVFPPPVTLFPLAVLGIAGWIKSVIRGGDAARVPLALIAWGGLLFGVFLPFYAGSYRYGVDIRFSLGVVAPYLLAAVAGAATVGALLGRLPFIASRSTEISTFVAILLIVPPLFFSLSSVARETSEAKQARADHTAVSLMARNLPENAVVVAHSPSVWANHGVAAVQLVRAFTRPGQVDRLFDAHEIFYHEDYWDIAGTAREAPGEPTPSEAWRALYVSEECARVEADEGWIFRLHRMRRLRVTP